MTTKQINAMIQFFSTYHNNRLIGTANIMAVNKESWTGERFFVENMQLQSYGLKTDTCRPCSQGLL